MKQNIVVLLTRAPQGRVHVPEGLRAARGVAAGFDRHDVTVLFTQDAVYAAREAVDRERLTMSGHIGDLLEEGGRLAVDGQALDERNVDVATVAPDVDVLSGADATATIREADHVIDF